MTPSKLIPKGFFRDRVVWLNMIPAAVLALISLLLVALRVRQTDFEVSVRYTSQGASTVELGEWWTLYGFAIFVLATFFINTLIAMRFYELHKGISTLVLALNLVVMVFTFLVTNALLSLPPLGS